MFIYGYRKYQVVKLARLISIGNKVRLKKGKCEEYYYRTNFSGLVILTQYTREHSIFQYVQPVRGEMA